MTGGLSVDKKSQTLPVFCCLEKQIAILFGTANAAPMHKKEKE